MRFIFALLLVILTTVAACYLDTVDHESSNTGIDGGVDSGMGSGSAMSGTLDPSPRDSDLELVVLGASLFIVVAPIGEMRRRRRNAAETKPHFS